MLRTLLSVLIAVTFAGTLQAAPCADVNMTVTASQPNDPGFEGLTKYTISGSWDIGQQQGISHISFLLLLEAACECVCDTGFLKFASPAGSSTGDDGQGGSCTVHYDGTFACTGDPTIPPDDAAIKFEVISEEGCESSPSGSGTWCFYSPIPPGPANTYTDAVALKYGTQECFGDLVGVLPDCSFCSTVAVDEETWSIIKHLFR